VIAVQKFLDNGENIIARNPDVSFTHCLFFYKLIC